MLCKESVAESPMMSVSAEVSLFPIPESTESFDLWIVAPSMQQAILDRQKIKQKRNQTLTPRSSAPIPTVKYMAS